MRPQRLRVRRWDDEVVVYDDRTGDTHILEDFAGQVLERLLHASAGVDELLMIAGGPGVDEADEQRRVAQVYDVIERLRRQGIVKPVRK